MGEQVMHTDVIVSFLTGGTCVACLGITVFFWRFWKETTDRLFCFFSIAFLLLGLGQLVGIFLMNTTEAPVSYWLRLFAFLLIIVGVVGKNLQKQ
jgi:hypothetical protein